MELREGCLTDLSHREFLTAADVVLVNNANGIFGPRSGDVPGTAPLDAHVAAIFAQLNPGARMVTFDPLLCLGRDVYDENSRRSNNGLDWSSDASFFVSEHRSIGSDAVSWSCKKEVVVYVYTRIEQSSTDGTAMFLCNNRQCKKGQTHGTPAVSEKTGLLQEECKYCGSKRVVKTRNAH